MARSIKETIAINQIVACLCTDNLLDFVAISKLLDIDNTKIEVDTSEGKIELPVLEIDILVEAVTKQKSRVYLTWKDINFISDIFQSCIHMSIRIACSHKKIGPIEKERIADKMFAFYKTDCGFVPRLTEDRDSSSIGPLRFIARAKELDIE